MIVQRRYGLWTWLSLAATLGALQLVRSVGLWTAGVVAADAGRHRSGRAEPEACDREGPCRLCDRGVAPCSSLVRPSPIDDRQRRLRPHLLVCSALEALAVGLLRQPGAAESDLRAAPRALPAAVPADPLHRYVGRLLRHLVVEPAPPGADVAGEPAPRRPEHRRTAADGVRPGRLVRPSRPCRRASTRRSGSARRRADAARQPGGLSLLRRSTAEHGRRHRQGHVPADGGAGMGDLVRLRRGHSGRAEPADRGSGVGRARRLRARRPAASRPTRRCRERVGLSPRRAARCRRALCLGARRLGRLQRRARGACRVVERSRMPQGREGRDARDSSRSDRPERRARVRCARWSRPTGSRSPSRATRECRADRRRVPSSRRPTSRRGGSSGAAGSSISGIARRPRRSGRRSSTASTSGARSPRAGGPRSATGRSRRSGCRSRPAAPVAAPPPGAAGCVPSGAERADAELLRRQRRPGPRRASGHPHPRA